MSILLTLRSKSQELCKLGREFVFDLITECQVILNDYAKKKLSLEQQKNIKMKEISAIEKEKKEKLTTTEIKEAQIKAKLIKEECERVQKELAYHLAEYSCIK